MKINGSAILVAFAAFGFLGGAVFLGMNHTHADAGLKPATEGPASRESVDGMRPPASMPTASHTASAAMPPALVEAERNLRLARAAYQGKDYDLAVSYLNEALRLRPDYRDALLERWLARIGADQWAEALADANAIIRLAPGDAELAQGYGMRAIPQLYLKNPDAAIRDCCEALRLKRKTAGVYATRGDAYRMKHECEKALADYSTAIQLDPHVGEAYTGRGQAYFLMGKFDEAFADLSRSIELKPNPLSYVSRGLCRANRGQPVAAIQDAWAALSLDSQYAPAYCLLSYSYGKLGDGQNDALYWAKYQELTSQQLGK